MAITEDYVSFETAKLLKEKGFNEYCKSVYHAGSVCSVISLGYIVEEKQNSDFGKYDNAISAPTLQMAMKWLRVVYHIAIETKWEHLWYAYIKPMTSWPFEKGYEDFQESSKYEYACEAAILYCLENMI